MFAYRAYNVSHGSTTIRLRTVFRRNVCRRSVVDEMSVDELSLYRFALIGLTGKREIGFSNGPYYRP